MKRYLIYFLVLLSAFAFSCSEDDDPTQTLNYELLDWTECSFAFSFQSGDSFIINDTASFNALIDTIAYTNCVNFDYPEIDFENYTLLGLFSEGGGCEASYDRSFTRNEDIQNYEYKVTVNYTGGCDMLIMHANWILVDKIPENAVVLFQLYQTSQQQ
ncbi:MAG: hypothetical protein C0599_16455 [Salinivirgaceae bacterium]|nr:MAG: hypothetical protein C0599_16455 [Salinivirgaceae bacterium]